MAYLEIWLRDFAKDYLRRISMEDHGYYPHITLVRPFDISANPAQVQQAITSFCYGKKPIEFSLKGKETFEQGIHYIPVTSPELTMFNNDLEKLLETIPGIKLREKLADEKVLHVTIPRDFDGCYEIQEHMLRLTAIKDKKIWFSYDFVLQKELNREKSLDRELWEQTKSQFLQNPLAAG